jgi:hypothetical protein
MNCLHIFTPAKQVQQLKQRVEELVKRIQQLVNLLRDANISIPSHLAVESSRPLRWSNKFNQEDGLMLLEKAKKSELHSFFNRFITMILTHSGIHMVTCWPSQQVSNNNV